MTAPARLLGLRVQGFKSFAERTLVEFGPGISAVVGPNGSGKSNLADALRWALGEQGRSLRIRRSEDVIWAGSDKRGAQGMADVTLVLDNADALLPVEFAVVELGRRLYRSGENDYLLNRQRVRLKDLVDLLDSANLADNAFLFIGQGMVDQALALRPEERRPLFEEVAGVRRHERRRRKAEEQLVEAEGNLARVEDILAELRPQARRLGQLAEQQATRLTAGEELAAALIAAAHGRWHEAAGRAAEADARRDALRCGDGPRAGGAGDGRVRRRRHRGVDGRAGGARAGASRRRTRRRAAEVTALGLRQARAAGRDRGCRPGPRVGSGTSARPPRPTSPPSAGSSPRPSRSGTWSSSRRSARRTGRWRRRWQSSGRSGRRVVPAATSWRRCGARRRPAPPRPRPPAAAARKPRAGSPTSRAKAAASEERRARLEGTLAEARSALAAAATAEAEAAAAREAARADADAAEGTRRAVAERAARAGSMLAGARGRLEQLERRLAEDEERGIARAARRLGGRRVDEDLGVEPGLRAAVEAALGDLARAYVVERHGAASLAGERGHVVVQERLAAAGRVPGGGTPAELRRLDDALASRRRWTAGGCGAP